MVNQMTKDCLQWEDALGQWRAVFAQASSNPWPQSHPSTISNQMSATSSMINSASMDIQSMSGTTNHEWSQSTTIPDIQDLWHDDRSKPIKYDNNNS